MPVQKNTEDQIERADKRCAQSDLSACYNIVDISFFGTKAETLESLFERLSTTKVLDQIRFTLSEWKEHGNSLVTSQLEGKGWTDRFLIARSSAKEEDRSSSSLAGHYKSVLNVKGAEGIRDAVTQIIDSYGDCRDDEQIFIQPMVDEVVASGVAFSKDPNTGSPYAVINFSDGSSTTAITSGYAVSSRTFYCLDGADTSHLPHLVKAILKLMSELKAITKCDSLDIEFALDKGGQIFLLQCRPLVCEANSSDVAQLNFNLDQIAQKMSALNKPHPYLLGARTIFAVMPDWNPAEIIGIRPKPLALSFYKELITDNIWAYQRSNYGYRNLRSFPLIVSFCGLPYVDLRVDFNSFIPADVSVELGDRLVNYYLDQLIANPSNHDKIEFEIVQTCYTFDMPERLSKLRAAGFSKQDCDLLSSSLRDLTNRIIHEKKGLWKNDIEKINSLPQRIESILSCDMNTVGKIYWLLEDCKRYGTLPFAGLARAGFIAVQLLKTLVSVGIFSQLDYDNFMSSLDSVSSRMKRDVKQLSRAAFLEKYGHLRPGTYDILSPRYDEDPDRYFDWSENSSTDGQSSEPKEFHLSLAQLRKIDLLLTEHGLEHDVLGFFDFIKSAIEGREFAKFVFSKSLSEALTLFTKLAAEHNFSVEDCSYANIGCIQELYGSSSSVGDILKNSIAKGKHDYDLACQLRLPSVIVEETDLRCFEILPSEPNFITQKSARGRVVFSGNGATQLKDGIVFIVSADPGFDWIFSHEICGLITMYGGVNSHMAIRAGELGIPSVIGAGEILYEEWSQASFLEIDCASRRVLRLK